MKKFSKNLSIQLLDRVWSYRDYSSETAVKLFKNYEGFQPSHIQNLDEDFLAWFIGFTEGDGCFMAQKNRNEFIIAQNSLLD